MASWPTGIETIKALIAAGNLQKVAPSLKSAQGFLAQAAGHLDSAQSVSETDRRVLAAVRRRAKEPSRRAPCPGPASDEQGRPLRDPGSHQRPVTKPPPRDAFRPFGRLRRTRNQIEYDDITPITADDVEADSPVVRTLHAMAQQLVDVLPVFTD